MAYFRGTEPETTLAKNAEWTSQTALRERHDTVEGSVYSEAEGTLYIEQSLDGSNWDVSTEHTIAGEEGKGFIEQLVDPYWRLRFKAKEETKELRIGASTQGSGDS